MIGEVWTAITPYYDSTSCKKRFKRRPVLIIAKADDNDYVVLPISKVSRQENLDHVYDIKVDPVMYPALGFTYVSYIRTHKQTIVNAGELVTQKSDLRSLYEGLYLEVLSKREEFSEEIMRQALE